MRVLCNVEKLNHRWLGPPALYLCWCICEFSNQLTWSLLQTCRDFSGLLVDLRQARGLFQIAADSTFVPTRRSAAVLYFLYFTVGDTALIVCCACFFGDGISSRPLTCLTTSSTLSCASHRCALQHYSMDLVPVPLLHQGDANSLNFKQEAETQAISQQSRSLVS